MGQKEGYLPFPESFETVCIHHSQKPSQWASKSVIPHIVMSTVFQIDDPMKPWTYLYSRVGNPTRSILENVIAALNKAKYGLCFSSGMSALTAVLGLLKKGEHIVCCEELSSESYEIFNNVAANFGIRTTFVDFNDVQNICEAIQDNTKLIWTENPSDPTLKISDLCCTTQIAKEKNILLGVDNTYLTPYLQRPIELGADIVLQSLTKYVNGHSDIIMGSLCMQCENMYKKLSLMQVVLGLVPSPFDCYQVLRGLKTLNLRMDQHHRNSIVIANFLEKHSAVDKVLHPGLKSHPQHELFKRQTSGHSGIISFYLKGDLEKSKQFLNHLNYFTITDVAGGNESTAQIPYSMSHQTLAKRKKARLNITENLIKISVGLENLCDLICDLEQALDKIKQENENCT